jgi:hypothetical protein
MFGELSSFYEVTRENDWGHLEQVDISMQKELNY